MRDVGKVFKGISLATPEGLYNNDTMVKLWIHECSRVFGDRLVNEADIKIFDNVICSVISEEYNTKYDKVVKYRPLLFGTFMKVQNKEGKQVKDKYHELDSSQQKEELHNKLNEALNEYNETVSGPPMPLVLFMDAMSHVTRICRILLQGHGTLIGFAGSGRRSLTRLSVHICEQRL